MFKKQLFLSIIIAVIVMMTASIIISGNFSGKTSANNLTHYPKNYTQAIENDKPVFILFYTDWCVHCVNFLPTYNKLEKLYKDKYNFVRVNVDKAENQYLAHDYNIMGIPTVYIINPVNNTKTAVDNYILHDIEKLKIKLDEYIKIK